MEINRNAIKADLAGPLPAAIPVSPPTVTSPFKVELSADGKAVRIAALLDGRLSVTGVGMYDATVHDLDPTEALWLATIIRANAEAIIAEQVAARRAASSTPGPVDAIDCERAGYHLYSTRHPALECPVVLAAAARQADES